MKNILIILAAAALLASCGLPVSQTGLASSGTYGLPVVSVSPSSTDAELAANPAVKFGYVVTKAVPGFDESAFAALGAELVSSFTLNGIEGTFYRLHKAEGVAKLIWDLRVTKGILYAEPALVSRLVKPVAGSASRALGDGDLANDPRSDSSEYSLAITHALESYDTVTGNGYGANTVYVAVIDTGINMAHEDFWYDADGAGPGAPVSIVEYAKSAFDKAADGTMTWRGDEVPFVTVPAGENWDDEAHGTHVSGTIAAVGDNGVGVAGVAWKQTKIISYKCFANATEGSGDDWSIYGALGDLADWVKAQRLGDPNFQATVPVNMSLGGDYAGSFELEMINYAVSQGVLPIVAMGNDGKRVGQFPASYQGVVAVGATNGMDGKVHFSNTGHWISVSAPGYDIISTGNGSDYWNDDTPFRQAEYQWMSGTSMATPFVTGLVGYLLSFDKTLTPYQVKAVLEQTADDKGAVGFDEDFGYGRVNVLHAATMVRTGVGLPVDGVAYVSSKIVVTVDNTSGNYNSGIVGFEDRVIGQPVYLYDSVGHFVSLGLTNGTNGEVEFRGLPPGDYTVKTNFFGSVGTEAVTLANGADQTVDFTWNKNIVYVSTVKNTTAGFVNGTDTMISIYNAETMLTADAVVTDYDRGTLDTLQVELPSGTYWAKITAYGAYKPAYNYIMQVGFSPASAQALADGGRAANVDDSHEQDDDGAAATLKGEFARETPFAANLCDADVFMFVVP